MMKLDSKEHEGLKDPLKEALRVAAAIMTDRYAEKELVN